MMTINFDFSQYETFGFRGRAIAPVWGGVGLGIQDGCIHTGIMIPD